MSSTTMLPTALSYINVGLSVIPIRLGDKRPAVKWEMYQGTIADAATLEEWFGAGDHNLGIVCGAASGALLVLDFDTNADEMYLRWCAAVGELAEQFPIVKTGKGYHVYLRCPNPGRNAKLAFDAEGQVLIETRAEGGYVIAPPSIHSSGVQYELLQGDLTAIPVLTELEATKLLEAAKAFDERPKAKTAAASQQACSPREAVPVRVETGGEMDPYVRAVLEGELTALSKAKEGTRNDTLNHAAFRLGQFIGSEQLDREYVETLLYGVAVAIGLTEREIRATIKSGIDAGMKQPCEIPQGSFFDPAIDTTDLGNAYRLVQRFGQDIHYVPAWGRWLVWDEKHWMEDSTGHVARLAHAITHDIRAEAEHAPTEDRRRALERWARTSQSKPRLDAMVDVAKTLPGIAVKPADLDAQHSLLNVRNGTIDLQTGELRPHQRKDLLTKLVDVEYHSAATAPMWLAFLHRVLGGDNDLVAFIQRAVGYSLTGSTDEQCLFFAYGTGANGKSTFSEVLLELVGAYAQKARANLLLEKKNGGDIPNDIARLQGARLVVASEIGEGRRLAEATVKDLTSNDTLSARFLHQEYFDFTPTHKLWVYGNHKPIIKGNDYGMWRRIKLIPFEVTIPEHERDPQLKVKLQAELAGILAWAVQGCLHWQQQGLRTPEKVDAATEMYRSEMDVIGAFLEECCEQGADKEVSATLLYTAYCAWCEKNRENAFSQPRFGRQLTGRGFGKKDDSRGYTVRTGLALRPETNQPQRVGGWPSLKT